MVVPAAPTLMSVAVGSERALTSASVSSHRETGEGRGAPPGEGTDDEGARAHALREGERDAGLEEIFGWQYADGHCLCYGLDMVQSSLNDVTMVLVAPRQGMVP